MFEKIKVLKKTTCKLYPFFSPSYDNCTRSLALLTGLIVIPSVNIILTKILTQENDKGSDFNINTALYAALATSIVSGLQQNISVILANSTMQALKKQNLAKLMDNHKDQKANFLLNSDYNGITSMQYVTVGLGVRDFTANAISVLITLPMYILTSCSSIISIGIVTQFNKAFLVTACCSLGTVGIFYLFCQKYYHLMSINQQIENHLVGKVCFIEANKETIGLIRAANIEYENLSKELGKVDQSIPKLSVCSFFNNATFALAGSIDSQFFGGYYTEFYKNLSNNDAILLNVIFNSLITNLHNIVLTLTGNHAYVRINLEQLSAFDEEFTRCLEAYQENKDKYKISFDDIDSVYLKDFAVYTFDDSGNKSLLIKPINISLKYDKIYYISGASGSGKTTFLKAITGNCQYAEGNIQFPSSIEIGSWSFIPQSSFIPFGTLLEVLLYPCQMQEFCIEDTKRSLHNTSNLSYSRLSSSINPEIDKVIELMGLFELDDLICKLDTKVNWNNLLSGGEKQKIGIIRSLIQNPQFLIMDEATSALDIESKTNIRLIIKKYIQQLESFGKHYIIMYTDHHGNINDQLTNFADEALTISGHTVNWFDQGTVD